MRPPQHVGFVLFESIEDALFQFQQWWYGTFKLRGPLSSSLWMGVEPTV